MPPLSGNLRERFEDEAAAVHLRMGNGQVGRVENYISVQQNIDIDNSGPFGLDPLASHLQFYSKQFRHELLGDKGGGERKGTVQEPRLFGEVDGLSFVDGRDGEHAATAGEA